MKKILMLTAAVAMCLCFAMPATAKVHVGGIVALDFYYHRGDSDWAANWAGLGTPANPTDDWQQLEIEVPGHTRLNANWVNDDGNVGMYIELGLGGANGATGVTLRHAYGWWQINPMFKLVAGHTDKSFATLNPGQVMGMNAGAPPDLHIIGIGFGNLYEGRVPQLRLETKFNDMITWKIAAADNHHPGTETDVAGNDEAVWPRVDTCVALNLGPVYLEPGFSWSKHKHDEGSLNAGAATSWNTFAFVLGVKFGFGPFSFAAEGMWGQNLANGDGWAAATGAGFGVLGVEYDNQLDFENSDDAMFWVDLGFKVGPATIHAIYGLQDTQGFITWWDGADWIESEVEWTRQMLGLSVPITVAKVFIIRPELFWYSWGDMDATEDFHQFFGTDDVDMGNEILGGVSFWVIF
jgi:hypothetical protein